MAALKGSKTEENLKAAFAGESQANRRYLVFREQSRHRRPKRCGSAVPFDR
jgi:rubrerythrin